MAVENAKREITQENSPKKKIEKKIVKQFLVAFLVNLNFLTAGLTFAWPGPSLPKLQDKSTDIFLTSSEASWIVSVMQIGACIGPLLSALLVDRVGRKLFLYLSAIPYLISWLLIFFAKGFEYLLIARIIGGIGVGAAFAAGPIYLSEIAETKLRGTLSAMSTTLLSSGYLLVNCVGPWTSRQILAVISIIPTVVFLVSFIWMPESPVYYLKKKSTESAKKSLSWLRDIDNVDKELNELSNLVEAEKENQGSIVELITVPTNRRATLITLIVLSTQQFAGLAAFSAYVGLILRDIPINFDEDIALIIIASVLFIMSIISMSLIDKYGRKTLLLISSIGVIICFCILAIYFHLKSMEIDVSSVTLIPMIVLAIIFLLFALGLTGVPGIIPSEVYPTNVKAWGTMLAAIYGSLMGSVISKIYQVVLDNYNYQTLFYGFAIGELFFITLVFFIVPETKGKSLKEIQDELEFSISKNNKTINTQFLTVDTNSRF